MSTHEEDMQAPLDLLGGVGWLRSSGYYVEDGLIRLRPGAEIEIYDPWEQWRTATDEERPYKRLVRLVQQLRPGRFGAPLPTRQRQLLEQWVQRNGLLGILPHQTLEATMAPRWLDEHTYRGELLASGEGKRSFVAVQRRQLRIGEHWPVIVERAGDARVSDPALEGELVGAKQLGGAGLPLDVLGRRIQDGRLERRPLEDHYHPFFADVPRAEARTYAYPGIDTKEFWYGYGESVHQFVSVARYLAAPLEALARLREEELSDDDRTLIWRALNRINAIASVVDYSGALTKAGEPVVGWSSPSLLGIYAHMLLSDLAARQKVRRCPNCDAFFLGKNPSARYCSSTCRYAQQKREWRKGKTEKRGGADAKGNAAE